MRAVLWTDARGNKHRSLVKDTDGDDMAIYGIPAEPPDLEQLDWDQIKRSLREIQSQQELWDYNALQRNQVGLQAIGNIVKRAVYDLYLQDYKQKSAVEKSKSGGIIWP